MTTAILCSGAVMYAPFVPPPPCHPDELAELASTCSIPQALDVRQCHQCTSAEAVLGSGLGPVCGFGIGNLDIFVAELGRPLLLGGSWSSRHIQVIQIPCAGMWVSLPCFTQTVLYDHCGPWRCHYAALSY